MKKHINVLVGYFKNLRIREKMLLSYIVLTFIPAMIITVLSYDRSTKTVEEQVIESTKQSFEQAGNFMLYKMDNIKDVSSILYMNKDIQRILGKNQNEYSLNEQIEDYNKLLDTMRSAQNYREIYMIRLIVKNDTIYSTEGNNIISESLVKDTDWYKKVIETGGIYWRPTYDQSYISTQGKNLKIISCIRAVNDEGRTEKILGAVSIDILEDSIYEIIKQTNITKHGEIFLVDENGVIISSKDKSKIGTNISSEKYFTSFGSEDKGYKKLKINNETSIVCYKLLEGTNWYLVSIIPLKEIVLPSRQILSNFVFIMGFMIFISMMSAYYISNSLTRRIRQLIKYMKKIEDDNWDIYIPVDSQDEIGMLQKHFNKMIENMRRLIREIYQAEITKKNAELKALQAQINPHFLYNTLDMMRWMALKCRAKEIASIASSLAKFFKLSLSNGRDIVTIQDEINHVKTYLDIQNRRFGNRIESIFDISSEINEMITVKLILQPIVENAIIHGIQEKESKTGYVKIKGERQGENIFILIEDNGVGMSMEKIEQLLNKTKTTGYGVKNVNERIGLYFGPQYGLEFESKKSAGTKVFIRFPAVHIEEGREKNQWL